ncbi:MAG: FecR domain-containing protein, partial [Proteobacteria bacterium]|nr:FecR domain-containing protein [Pseudomonadota bacterium]
MSSPQNPKSIEDTNVQLEQIGIVSTIVEGQEPITATAIDGTTRILISGEPIYLHDVVSTTDNSYIKIILDDDTVFQLGPKSQASLDKYVYDPDISSGEFEAFVSSGSFHYISGKISGDNQGQHTLIKTPSAQIGIRGSEITAEISTDGSTTILHMSGLITVISNYTLEEILVYENGTSIYVPIDNTSNTLNLLTEEQLQHHVQEWQIDNSITPEIIMHNSENNSEDNFENDSEDDFENDSENDLSEDNLEEDESTNINDQHSSNNTDIHQLEESLEKEPVNSVVSKTDLSDIHREIREAGIEEERKDPFEQHPSHPRDNDTTLHNDEKPPQSSQPPQDNLPKPQLPAPDINPDKPKIDDGNKDDINKDGNDKAIAKDDRLEMGNNETITISIQDLLRNDKHSKDDLFEIINTTNGIVKVEQDNVIFTRDAEFSGVYDNGFNYKIGSATAHVSITGNLSPIAVTDDISTLKNN